MHGGHQGLGGFDSRFDQFVSISRGPGEFAGGGTSKINNCVQAFNRLARKRLKARLPLNLVGVARWPPNQGYRLVSLVA